MWGVEISAHIDALARDGALLADAAEAAGLRAVIPGCPGWQGRDLVRHQAYVHDWAPRPRPGRRRPHRRLPRRSRGPGRDPPRRRPGPRVRDVHARPVAARVLGP